MSAARARREASLRLGLALGTRFKDLSLAVGESEIQTSAVLLGTLFNDNIEFIMWVLKEYGGAKQMPFQPQLPAFPKLSPVVTGLDS